MLSDFIVMNKISIHFVLKDREIRGESERENKKEMKICFVV